MNDSMVVCPRCQKEVTLVIDGQVPTCPECGLRFQYRMPGSGAPPRIPQSNLREGVGDVFSAIVKVILIMAVIVVVGVAVLFAGCVIMVTGHH